MLTDKSEQKVSLAEIFVLPYRDRFILSIPLCGQYYLVNASLVMALQTSMHEGIYESTFENLEPNVHLPEKSPEQGNTFSPTSIVIFVTNGCNLNCQYCFAAPLYRKPQFISEQFVQAGLDLAAKNAHDMGTILSVHFSGGEPLLNPAFTKRLARLCSETARRHNLPLHMGLTTNGNIDEQTAKFISNDFDYVSFSVDGIPEIQQFHRPTINGKAYFAKLDRALQILTKSNLRVEIRSTFTNVNVDKMPDILGYFHSRWGIKRYCFVPLRETSRSQRNELNAPSPERFFRAFIATDKIADNLGVTLYYSAYRHHRPSPGDFHFCSISRDYFGLTQSGFITACSQFPRQNPLENPLAFYLYGKFDEATGKIEIDEEKREVLHKLNLTEKSFCIDCFARWSCKGDCPARLFGYPDDGNPNFLELYRESPSPCCHLNQMLAHYYALKRLSLPFDDYYPGDIPPRHRITSIDIPFSSKEKPKVLLSA